MRKIRRLAVVVLSCLTLSLASAHAESVNAQLLIDTGLKAYSEQKLLDADKLFAQLIKEAGDNPKPDHNLALAYQYRGIIAERSLKFAVADDFLQRALDMFAQLHEDESRELAPGLFAFADSKLWQKKPAEAEVLAKRAVDIAEKCSMPTAARVQYMNPLAAAYDEQGKSTQAIDCINKALSLYRADHSAEDAESIKLQTVLARYYMHTEQKAEGIRLFEHLIDLIPRVAGPNSDTMAIALTHLAMAYEGEDKAVKALPINTRALEIIKRLGLEETTLGATIYSDQAIIESDLDRFRDAELDMKRSLSIRQKLQGSNSPAMATDLSMLGWCLENQGKLTEAEPCLNEALKQSRKYFGESGWATAATLMRLSKLMRLQGKYSQAEELIGQALAVEKQLGPKAPMMGAILTQYAMIRDDQHAYADAENYYKQALHYISDMHGPMAANAGNATANIGYFYVKQNRIGDAEPYFQRALDIFKQCGDTAHSADMLLELGKTYMAQKKFPDAETVYKQMLNLDDQFKGHKSAAVASDLQRLAEVYRAEGNDVEARLAKENAEQIMASLPGYRAPSQATSSDTSGGGSTPVKDKWAVVIGISKFKDPSINLLYPAKDATDFRNFLVSDENFRTDHTRLLVNEQATRENIIAQLGDKWLGRLANKDDLVVVYLSSHGSAAQEGAGGTNFLVAYDTNKNSLLGTGIPMQWLLQILKDQVHCDRVVVIVDVCHGGAVKTADKGLARENGFNPNAVVVGNGQAVLTSCEADQVSWESNNYANSVFTRRLIEGLKHGGQKTNLFDAFAYTRDQVESEVLRDRAVVQTPVLRKSWTGAAPVLSVMPAAPRSASLEASHK